MVAALFMAYVQSAFPPIFTLVLVQIIIFIEPVTFARLYLHCGISHWADI